MVAGAEKRRKAPQGARPRPPKCGDESPPGFSDFWNQWPRHERKIGKANCLRIWHRKGLEKVTGKVTDALRRCKVSHDWQKQSGDFIPRPQSWLNSEPWETDPADMVRATDGDNGFARREPVPGELDDIYPQIGGGNVQS